MKEIIVSIKPKWCEIIANGKKTIEVRKTAPTEVPFKCYIYQTKSRDNSIYRQFKVDDMRCGKIIGEFICDYVYTITNNGSFTVNNDTALTNGIARDSCLDYIDMRNYLGTKDGYAWHISELIIYNKPKELSEFGKLHCNNFDDYIMSNQLTRPPQSWQYVKHIS